jgi:hypothetical protein
MSNPTQQLEYRQADMVLCQEKSNLKLINDYHIGICLFLVTDVYQQPLIYLVHPQPQKVSFLVIGTHTIYCSWHIILDEGEIAS